MRSKYLEASTERIVQKPTTPLFVDLLGYQQQGSLDEPGGYHEQWGIFFVPTHA